MSKLREFKVDESKVWFGDYWPEGVPKQIYEVEGIVVEPLFEGFQRCATYIEFIKELPVTATGKVLKLELQKSDLNKLKEGKEIK